MVGRGINVIIMEDGIKNYKKLEKKMAVLYALHWNKQVKEKKNVQMSL